MMTTRERVDFAELVLRDLQARAAEAEKVKQNAWREYLETVGHSDPVVNVLRHDEYEAALNVEYQLVNQCIDLEAELVELQRVLATCTDPHPSIQEGAL